MSHWIKLQRTELFNSICPLERSAKSDISARSCISHGKKLIHIIYEAKEKNEIMLGLIW